MTLFRMFQRRGTAAQWQAANTVLAVGEIGFSYDNNVIKVGDGVTAWNSLASLDGKSAYETAVSNGFEGTEAAWLASLVADLDLPAQSGNAGKYLSTDGTELSWEAVDALPDQSGNSGKYLGTNGSLALWQAIDLSSKQNVIAGVSDTEIGYLDGVTSAIQTQLNTKAPLASPSFTGSVNGNPGNPSSNNTAKALGYVGLPQVQISGPKTFSETDAGKHQWVDQGGLTLTIPSNSSVPLEIGTTFVVINNGNISTTIAITSDDLRLAGTSTNGSRTLGNYGVATIVKVKSTTWVISGNGLT